MEQAALTRSDIAAFLETLAPYNGLPANQLSVLTKTVSIHRYAAGESIYKIDTPLEGIHIIVSGTVDISDRDGKCVSQLEKRQSFGERGLLRDGNASTNARARTNVVTLLLPAETLHQLIEQFPAIAHFFYYGERARQQPGNLNSLKVRDLITRKAISCSPETPVTKAAQTMRDQNISCLAVVKQDTQALVGIVTVRDLTFRVLAQALDASIPVSEVMTPNPPTLSPDALGSDVLRTMMDHNIGHLAVIERNRFYGIITQTDLTRFQAVSSALLIHDISQASNIEKMVSISSTLPRLLVQLVASQQRHEIVTRHITDITDAITRRLLAMAEEQLGTPPMPYLWLACGSQGRQEQTGVSDQDNCLFLDDRVTPDDMPYFEQLARFVCDGLNACGYVYCPGDMMAINSRWRQPVATWRNYFQTWMNRHAPESHMLASVMFDLRPIAGHKDLFQNLQAETLEAASKKSIFMAHMVANSLKHTPPLGLLRGFSTVRTKRGGNQIDLKHNGVIPVTDLARVYALQSRLREINTRARLQAAEQVGMISSAGARELIAAYDLIATLRLENQMRLIQAGQKPDNYLALSELPDFQRHHLRDAFVVVRTMQAAISQGRRMPV
ncbi:MAG: CBS domain-containing protein [Pusillimonas sp.]|nr:CBS domain-containing protein [Pusillimonas sp.]